MIFYSMSKIFVDLVSNECSKTHNTFPIRRRLCIPFGKKRLHCLNVQRNNFIRHVEWLTHFEGSNIKSNLVTFFFLFSFYLACERKCISRLSFSSHPRNAATGNTSAFAGYILANLRIIFLDFRLWPFVRIRGCPQ